MIRRKNKSALSHLGPHERAEVLSDILDRHPELREEANAIAEDLLCDASVEAISEEVTDLVLSIGLEELESRAGKQPWGYVEPSEAAWELLEESIENIQQDMKRRMQVGMETPAEKLCQAVVVGLYEARKTKSDGALAWAPDFPAEAAAQSVSNLVELYPGNRRRAAGKRIIAGVEQQAEEWMGMLHRVIERMVSSKSRMRKRK